jgi:hypothetical protein
MTLNPLEKIEWRGWDRMDRKTAAALSIAERRLGYQMDVVQGPYNPGGVGVSAGTHDKGGVVDLSAFDKDRKVKVLRDLGFAAWYRPALAGKWPAHIHAVMIGHQDLAPSAFNQVLSYERGRDGLAGDNLDPNTYRPDTDDFSYAMAMRDEQLRTRIIGINATRKKLLDQIAAKKARRERLRIKAAAAKGDITYT